SHFTASTSSATGATLSWWDMSNNETGFEIERKTGSGGAYSRVVTTGANISAATNSGLSGGTTYYFRCRAVNASGPSAYSNEVSLTTPAAAIVMPAAPTNF